jgi:hypothetical protein
VIKSELDVVVYQYLELYAKFACPPSLSSPLLSFPVLKIVVKWGYRGWCMQEVGKGRSTENLCW